MPLPLDLGERGGGGEEESEEEEKELLTGHSITQGLKRNRRGRRSRRRVISWTLMSPQLHRSPLGKHFTFKSVSKLFAMYCLLPCVHFINHVACICSLSLSVNIYMYTAIHSDILTWVYSFTQLINGVC